MKIIVQKFGGTSVSTVENRAKAVEKVAAAKASGCFPVVVVSAMGRRGEAYATDTLIDFARNAFKEANPRELDLIISCGETISSVILAAELRSRGMDAAALTGAQAGIITDNNYGNAGVLRVETKNIYRLIERGRIPVITGFQGVTEYGDITTLGRGGSDITAAVIGEAINAHLVEIYTDVDGVMTADPRVVPNARVIKSVDYSEVFQMADYGAKVVHPRAVEIAMRSGVPIVIKNTFSDSPGTLITEIRRESDTIDMGSQGLLTGIAHLHDRTQIVINHQNCSDSMQDGILEKLAEMGVSIDLINIFTDKKVFTIDEKDTERVKALLEKEQLQFEINSNCSKVTVIGSRIRGVPGVMARIYRTLSAKGIKVFQTADSYTTISVLIKTEDTEKAVMALHDEFKLSR
ncbi:MAG: Aspartokinase [Firmicutes bacterium]|nr:Aspartokinase [Bacillota bacterium]MDI6704731.1 aspartate kinase [Bacillota bacterium]